MRYLALTFIFLAATAHAQWGIGLMGGNTCPNPYQMANGAYNGNDEVLNLKGQLTQEKRLLAQEKSRLEKIDSRIAHSKTKMRRVLTSQSIQAIDEHRRFDRSSESYQTSCDHVSHAGSVGGADANVILPAIDGDPGTSSDNDVAGTSSLVPPFSNFCYKHRDYWKAFVDEDGKVNDSICDYRIPEVEKGADPDAQSDCKQGLDDYYDQYDEKVRIQNRVTEIDAKIHSIRGRLDEIQDEITEGDYCPTCAAMHRGYAQPAPAMSTGTQLLGILGAVGVGLFKSYEQRQIANQYYNNQMQIAQLNARAGWPTPMGMPPMMGRPPMPMFGGFQTNPYPAMIPGYMGTYNGMYGAVPGMMGPGSFGCQGTNPFGMSPMAPGMMPYMGPNSPFNNPYLASNPFMNPMMGMMRPGAGPWGMPMGPFGRSPFGAPGMMPYLANGMPNPYGMGGMGGMFGNPYGGMYNPYGMGGMGGMFGNPYGGMYNPYGMGGMGPYGGMYNPYGMGGMYNPYGLGGLGGAPGMLPYNGYGGLNGYGLRAPGVLPYMANNPYAPGSPVGSYYYQMQQLQGNLSYIQNGYYGGNGALAPPVLPFPSQPVYNTPGTPLNPIPAAGPAPAAIPMNGTSVIPTR